MSPYRIQAFIDIAGWLEWLIRRVSVLALLLLLAMGLLNMGKTGMVEQIAGSLLCLLLINAVFTGIRRLAESFQP